MMYQYKVRVHGKKRPVVDFFKEQLIIGDTYAGTIGIRHCLFDVLELLQVIE